MFLYLYRGSTVIFPFYSESETTEIESETTYIESETRKSESETGNR